MKLFTSEYTYDTPQDEKRQITWLNRLLLGDMMLTKAIASKIIFTNKRTRKQIRVYTLVLSILFILQGIFLNGIDLLSMPAVIIATLLSNSLAYYIERLPYIKENKREIKKEVHKPIIKEIVKEEIDNDILTREEEMQSRLLFIDPIDIFIKSPNDFKTMGISIKEYYNQETKREVNKIVNYYRKGE